ncbi:MAG: S41 family peptidase [Deltaproteobacteria bacterium]|nr:S41 family peptidase [Deltaproteobacteria bacterium]NNE18573.1 S41 family peptidase [Myxococcales bacterium]
MFRHKTGRKTLRLFFVSMLALALVAVMASEAPARRSPFEPLSIFARALAYIEVSYVEPVDQKTLVYGAIQGLADSLDPHSVFLDPEEYQILRSDAEGRFAGVGVEVSTRDGWLTILSVFDGGPAAKAGLQPGDRFLSIEGEDARDVRLYDAVRRIRGEPGTAVTVSIRRKGREVAMERTLTRAFIEIDPIDMQVLDDGLVYVRIKAFQEGATRQLSDALDEAVMELRKRGGLRGLLLDLRDNGGGLLHEAVGVSDEFLSAGVIVSTRGRGGEMISQYSARRAGTRPKWPIVVLINENTASASEIVAGALRDHKRAVLVGVRSFGKGSVQNVFELPGGSALKLTTYRYYAPSGSSIQAEGISPDLVAEQPRGADDPAPLREEELEGHLRAQPNGVPGVPKQVDRRPEAPAPTDQVLSIFADDSQGQRGYAVLKGKIGR